MCRGGRPRLISRPCSRTGKNPPYGILGRAMETSASYEARSAPSLYPTGGRKGHSQKTGGHLSTFRRLGVPKSKPLSFQAFTDSLTDREKRISFFSLVHSFPRDGRYAPRLPNLELIPLPIPPPLCPLFSIAYELKI